MIDVAPRDADCVVSRAVDVSARVADSASYTERTGNYWNKTRDELQVYYRADRNSGGDVTRREHRGVATTSGGLTATAAIQAADEELKRVSAECERVSAEARGVRDLASSLRDFWAQVQVACLLSLPLSWTLSPSCLLRIPML